MYKITDGGEKIIDEIISLFQRLSFVSEQSEVLSRLQDYHQKNLCVEEEKAAKTVVEASEYHAYVQRLRGPFK